MPYVSIEERAALVNLREVNALVLAACGVLGWLNDAERSSLYAAIALEALTEAQYRKSRSPSIGPKFTANDAARLTVVRWLSGYAHAPATCPVIADALRIRPTAITCGALASLYGPRIVFSLAKLGEDTAERLQALDYAACMLKAEHKRCAA